MPVYNPGVAFERLLASLRDLAPEIEIIFIDDGCTDGSRNRIESFLTGRALLISGENLGPGRARNLGLKAAKGKFVAFADADDECRTSILLELVKEAENLNADVVIAGYELVSEGSNRSEITPVPIPLDQVGLSGARCVLERSAVWGKIYRRTFLNDNDVFFPESRGAEDVVFSYWLAASRPKTATSNLIAYVYYKSTHGQLTSTREYFIQGTSALKRIVENFPKDQESGALLAQVVLSSLPHLVRGIGLATGIPQSAILLTATIRIFGVRTLLGASVNVLSNRAARQRQA